MNEEFSNGVKIILSRVESHPEEFRDEFSPWKELMNTVLNYKVNPKETPPHNLRSFTHAEIDALHAAFFPIARQEFDEWVMKKVFNAGESTQWDEHVTQSPIQPGLFAQGKRVQQAQLARNVIPAGSWQTVATQTSNTPVTTAIKKALGMK